MTAKARREALLEALKRAEHPLSATALAERSGVSRQIIVGDIALLRAAGAEILATPRGYTLRGAAEPAAGARSMAAARSADTMRAWGQFFMGGGVLRRFRFRRVFGGP